MINEKEKVRNSVQIFVDGSYNKDTNLTGAGIIILYNEEILKKAFLVKTEEEHSWNINGECHAVLEALAICVGKELIGDMTIDEKYIVINYDYLGIEKWATGEWKAKSKIAKLYVKEFNNYVSTYGLKVSFNKIKSHSGNEYNDMADKLAYSMTQQK